MMRPDLKELQATACANIMPSMAFMADSFKLIGKKHPEIDEDEEEMDMDRPGLIDDDPGNSD